MLVRAYLYHKCELTQLYFKKDTHISMHSYFQNHAFLKTIIFSIYYLIIESNLIIILVYKSTMKLLLQILT